MDRERDLTSSGSDKLARTAVTIWLARARSLQKGFAVLAELEGLSAQERILALRMMAQG